MWANLLAQNPNLVGKDKVARMPRFLRLYSSMTLNAKEIPNFLSPITVFIKVLSFSMSLLQDLSSIVSWTRLGVASLSTHGQWSTLGPIPFLMDKLPLIDISMAVPSIFILTTSRCSSFPLCLHWRWAVIVSCNSSQERSILHNRSMLMCLHVRSTQDTHHYNYTSFFRAVVFASTIPNNSTIHLLSALCEKIC